MAQLADGADVDAYVDLFTPDGSWEMPGAPRRGHDDIRAGSLARRAAGDIGPGSHTRHVVTILSVAVDGDDADGGVGLAVLRRHRHRADGCDDGHLPRRPRPRTGRLEDGPPPITIG